MSVEPSEAAPVACTLGAGDFKTRLAAIANLNSRALRGQRRDDLRLELTYAADAREAGDGARRAGLLRVPDLRGSGRGGRRPCDHPGRRSRPGTPSRPCLRPSCRAAVIAAPVRTVI